MYFATFYQQSAMDKACIVEACGDRAVIILDGRSHAGTHHQLSARACRERGFVAYQLHKGNCFTRISKSTGIYRVTP